MGSGRRRRARHVLFRLAVSRMPSPATAVVDEIAWGFASAAGVVHRHVARAGNSRRGSVDESAAPVRITMQQAQCAVNHSRSQFSEDLLLLPTLLLAAAAQPITQPSFVELGAFNGITFSNTLMLERCFGWHGLLIEANPRNFKALQRSGRASTMVHSAVCAASPSSEPQFVKMMDHGEQFAAQDGSLTEEKLRKIPPHLRKWSTANVPCRPLPAIMAASGMPSATDVTLLSLDVEGAEDRVLANADPAAFRVLMAELDGIDRAKDARAEALITAHPAVRKAHELRVRNSQVYLRASLGEVFVNSTWLVDRGVLPADCCPKCASSSSCRNLAANRFNPTAEQLLDIVTRASRHHQLPL